MFPWLSMKWPGALFAWAMLGLLAAPVLARDKDAFRGQPPDPPPEPNPLEVEVPRGGPVWITLSAYSLTSPIVRYRIRRQPKEGQLGTPRLTDADTAIVKYTPPAGSGPGEDSFSYQVQSTAGVSAPAEVRIRITDKDPRLVAPQELDFGEVLPGESSRRLLLLQNIGGGVAEGKVRLPDGWAVEGDAAYRVGAGAKQSFTIVFTPQAERQYTGDVEYTGDLDRATDLVGKGVASIEVTPGPVELEGAGNVRAGTIQVQNRTDKPRTLRVKAGPDLVVEPVVNAPAKGVAEIAVQTKAGEEGEIHDEVTVEGDGVKADVPVHAATMKQMQTRAANAANAHAGAPPPGSIPRPVATAAAAGGAFSSAGFGPLSLQVADSWADPGTPMAALNVERTGENGARFTCNFGGAGPARYYSLEMQTVAVDAQGRPQAQWLPFPNAKVVANGTKASAEVQNLRPGALYVARMVALDEQGNLIAVSAVGQLWTARQKKGGYLGWVLAGAVVLAGLGVWKWKATTATP